MAVHPTTTKRKKRTGHKTGHNMTSHIPVDTFDPVDSAADNLADAVMRKSARFMKEKNRLKQIATKALSDSPFK